MYALRFYKEDMPPVLNNGVNDITILNYVVGSPNDPHWKLYPKELFLSARNMFPINYAFTDYSADANHYIYYMPENGGPTLNYSRLLRDHFEIIHGYRQKAIREKQQRENQERAEKIKQLKALLIEQNQLLKKFKDEFPKLKSNRDRAIRSETRSGTPREIAEVNYDNMNPMYVNTAGSIITIESNIYSLKNELKSYTD
tara:strand:- start:451 stop:1047 length:597 start_codon:yes stop_codon:yes gene_type:complete